MKAIFLLFFLVASVHADVGSEEALDEQLKIGLSLINEKKYQLAEVHFQNLSEQYPAQIVYLNNLAVTQMALGKTNSALDSLKKAAVSDKNYSVLQKNVSDIYAYMASQAYTNALEKKQTVSLPELVSIVHVKKMPVAKPEPINETEPELNAAIEERTGQQLKDQIETKTAAWISAWKTGDIKQYISSYSTSFLPAGNVSYSDWSAQRRYRFRHSKQVDVSYNQLNIFFDAEKKSAITEFVQHYKAGNYQDKVRKQLYWKQENDSWLITREQVVEKL